MKDSSFEQEKLVSTYWSKTTRGKIWKRQANWCCPWRACGGRPIRHSKVPFSIRFVTSNWAVCGSIAPITQRTGVGEDRFEGQSTGEGGLREKKRVGSRMNSISFAKTFFLFCLDDRCGEDREALDLREKAKG